jgi:hypothetical protein
MPKTRGQKIGLAVGLAFLALVVGLLAYLHLGATVEVPRNANGMDRPIISVCKGAPAWIRKDLPDAMDFWKKHGVAYGHVVLAADCPAACEVKDRKGGPRLISCHEGGITIDLMDQAFDGDHGGETISVKQGDTLRYATILLPFTIANDVTFDDEGVMQNTVVPKDVSVLVLAHELGHAEGYAHSVTPVVKGVVSHKTGELMNPETAGLGWGDEGLVP